MRLLITRFVTQFVIYLKTFIDYLSLNEICIEKLMLVLKYLKRKLSVIFLKHLRMNLKHLIKAKGI